MVHTRHITASPYLISSFLNKTKWTKQIFKKNRPVANLIRKYD